MKIKCEISRNRLTVSGKPALDFICEHCRLRYGGLNIDAYFWQSCLPKEDLEKAMEEFVSRLNNQDVRGLFPKEKTGKKLINALCHCDPKVVDLDFVRSVKRAKAILEAGLKLIRDHAMAAADHKKRIKSKPATSVLLNGIVEERVRADDEEFDDGTVQIMPRTDMFGRAAIDGDHSNYGYSGYYKFFVFVDGKRRRLTNAWRLFPNNEHHYKRQYEKKDVVAHIAATFAGIEGRAVNKIKGGWEIQGL